MARYRNKLHSRDFQVGGKYRQPDWYCEGCKTSHPGVRDMNVGTDGNNYCNQELMRFGIRHQAELAKQATQSN